ncbi:MAG: PTS fructose transporter subunit IIA, partial [Rhodospirillaceae bacterium]|nr:PTS fructose transporter subunit IIA [Rhodospirillaceae bacterium]
EVEVIAGVNLPMLIQLARSRQTQTLEGATNDAQDAGKKYISVASKLLADREK